MSNNTKLFIKVLRFISKPKFNALVTKFQSDKRYRKFFSYQHLVAFVFAQFNSTTSLRELNWAMQMNCNLKKVLHLDSINLSSLSRANNHRSYQLFENLFFYLLARHALNLSHSEISLFKVIDGTFLTLSSKLFSRANFSPDTKAVKLISRPRIRAFCLDLSKEIPEQVFIDVGEADDNAEILKSKLHPGFTYIFDRGYCSHTVYSHFNENGIFFITRLPPRWSYETKEEFEIEKGTNIVSDKLIKLGKNQQEVKGDLRLIT